jgi:hypothetical protein
MPQGRFRRAETPNVVRKVDASLLAKLVSEKCVLALPLDRQRRELARLGLDAPDRTIQSYWAYTTDLLAPIADATLATVFSAPQLVRRSSDHGRPLTRITSTSRRFGSSSVDRHPLRLLLSH